MRKTLLIVLGLLTVSHLLMAQYETSVGVRVGGTSGFVAKHFYRPSFAVEGILGSFPHGVSLTGLAVFHADALNTPGLFWYYGGGAHLSIFAPEGRYYTRFGREIRYDRRNRVGVGFDGLIGLEYRLPDNIPVTFSFDFKPLVEFGSDRYVGFALDPALSIRYIVR